MTAPSEHLKHLTLETNEKEWRIKLKRQKRFPELDHLIFSIKDIKLQYFGPFINKIR